MSSVNNNKPTLNSTAQSEVQQALTQSSPTAEAAALVKAQQDSGLSPQDFERAMDAFMKQSGASKSQIKAADSLLPGGGEPHGAHGSHGSKKGDGTDGADGTSSPTPTTSSTT